MDSSHPTLHAVFCDIDGTITGPDRRLNLQAVETIRTLVDNDIQVVLASGNTICSLYMLARMIGTEGAVIAENGGVYKRYHRDEITVLGNHNRCLEGYKRLEHHFASQGIDLIPFSNEYRYSDVAFARNVNPDEVRHLLSDMEDLTVLDSDFALHIVSKGITKGTGLLSLAPKLGLIPKEILAVGDSENDYDLLLNAGIGVAVANGAKRLGNVADYITEKKYGDGFSEAVRKYFPSLF